MGRPRSRTELKSRCRGSGIGPVGVGLGLFDGELAELADEAIAGHDRIRGLDLSEVAVDGSQAKAPCGGEGTGPNPTDRAKLGWKWSIATEADGVPIGWAADGANRHDIRLLAPTLDTVEPAGRADR